MADRGSRIQAREHDGKVNRAVLRSTRRDFLRITAVSAGGLVLGVRCAPAVGDETREFRPNAWVRIDPSGKIVLTVDKSEMGQGVRTSLPMILAEELEIDPDAVELFQASPGPDFQDMGTHGSRSTRTLWLPLRTAGAAAREMLVAAAAGKWGVAPASCRAEGGRVHHPPSNRSLGYGELAEAASRLPVPASPALKPRKAWRVIGKDRRRVDGPRIVAGEATFASDVRKPGMKVASVIRCPVDGGRVKSWDDAKARSVPGVRVARVSAGLAVIGDDTWAVLTAREALEPTIAWDDGADAVIGSAEVLARLTAAFDEPAGSLRRGGDAAKALAVSARRIEAEYFYPYQVHAPVEPMSAAADVRPGRCEIWAGTQNPNRVQSEAAKLLGVPESAVSVNVTLLGGGFGRRGRTDFVLDAVEASRAAGAPVRVLWTRPDDMRNGDFHPISLHRMAGGLDAAGEPAAWRHRVAVASNSRSRGEPLTEERLRGHLRGAYDVPYAIPAVETTAVEVASPVRVSSWRGVQHNHNVFATECFLDELAQAAGRDPFAYRMALLRREAVVPAGRDGAALDRGRLAAALALAGEKANWARPLRPGRGKGVACWSYDGRTPVAVVAEVAVSPDGSWRVDRIVCAIDCGVAVNPLGIRAQVEGSVAWALSALSTEITLKAGRVEQSNYGDLPILRLRDMPRVETHIVDSDAAPTGMGEPPVPVTTAAVANALSAASGRRVRRLPLRAAERKGA